MTSHLNDRVQWVTYSLSWHNFQQASILLPSQWDVTNKNKFKLITPLNKEGLCLPCPLPPAKNGDCTLLEHKQIHNITEIWTFTYWNSICICSFALKNQFLGFKITTSTAGATDNDCGNNTMFSLGRPLKDCPYKLFLQEKCLHTRKDYSNWWAHPKLVWGICGRSDVTDPHESCEKWHAYHWLFCLMFH